MPFGPRTGERFLMPYSDPTGDAGAAHAWHKSPGVAGYALLENPLHCEWSLVANRALRVGREADPYSSAAGARLRKLDAVPQPEFNWWLLGAVPLLASSVNRRRKAISGQAWVPAASLRADRRRFLVVVLLAAVWVALIVAAAADVKVAALLVLPVGVVLLLVIGVVRRLRVHAVYDRPTGQVGVFGTGVRLTSPGAREPDAGRAQPRQQAARPRAHLRQPFGSPNRRFVSWLWGLLSLLLGLSWVDLAVSLARDPAADLRTPMLPVAGVTYLLLAIPIVIVDVAHASRHQPSKAARTRWVLALILLNAPASLAHWGLHIRPKSTAREAATPD